MIWRFSYVATYMLQSKVEIRVWAVLCVFVASYVANYIWNWWLTLKPVFKIIKLRILTQARMIWGKRWLLPILYTYFMYIFVISIK